MELEETFTKIVTKIFNNWTALRLSVDNSMGGPNSKSVALDFVNYMVQFCLYEPNLTTEKIQDAIEDILDEEFETVCEDESPKEIALILSNFTIFLKEGKLQECEIEFEKLPSINEDWLKNQQQKTRNHHQSRNNDEESSSSDSSESAGTEQEASSSASMDQDNQNNEWTEVKSRRKRS